MSRNWSSGLISSMKDAKMIVEEDDKLVVIKDKYPKAKHHYLILPRDNIRSLSDLEETHIPLLNHMSSVADKLIKGKNAIFSIGFHAIPSMQQLHLHVISDDFISPCLKTKIHWNSFTTNFFVPIENIISDLKQDGFITKLSPSVHKQLMQTALKCNKCDFIPKNIPALKEHLFTHDC